MNTHKQRGVVHILLLAVLVLVVLSGLARCDIDNARADEVKPNWEIADAMESNPYRSDIYLPGPVAVRRGL